MESMGDIIVSMAPFQEKTDISTGLLKISRISRSFFPCSESTL